VAELKKLFERIAKATDPKVKGQLAVMAKKLDESIKNITKEIHELYEQIQKTAKPVSKY
jgi:phosphate uptake regulator